MIGWDDSARWPAGALPGIGPFDRRVIAAGGIVCALLMAVSARYGFDRDELYFLDCARHLQASYVDQPVLGPLLAWVSLHLFGVSLPGLRVWPIQLTADRRRRRTGISACSGAWADASAVAAAG
jgi:hypothetical protein